MKKGFYVLATLFFVLSSIFTLSCKKTITYEEMKAAEVKILKRIISEYNIEVMEEYPADGVFGERQFVHLPSGIYLNVIDSGNGNRAEFNKTEILVRVSGSYYISADSAISFSTFSNTNPPMEFRYGLARNVVDENSYSYYSAYYTFFGTGIESIMSYVGDSAVVRLIVPGYAEISNYPASSSFQNSAGNMFIPIYFDRVRYTFY